MSDENIDLDDLDALEGLLQELRMRHSVLDDRIESLTQAGEGAFEVMTLKREKLRIKDKIAWITTKLTPDIIA